MYLHLGNNIVVKTGDIVGVFDIDYCSVGKRTRDFLRAAQTSGSVVNVTGDLPKTFVVCREDGKDKVYISGISPATLRKRAETV